MRTRFTNLLLSLTLLLAGGALSVIGLTDSGPADAAINKQVNFQARLTDANGNIVGDGNYNVEFKLMTVASGGDTTQGSCTTSCVWRETRLVSATQGVAVSRGLFAIQLGEITSLASVDFNQDLYLSVRIGNTGSTPSWDPEMTPRHRMGAAPTAIHADNAAQLNGNTAGNASGQIALNNGTVNMNLNADLLDGQSGTYYNAAGNLTGTVADARLTGNVALLDRTGQLFTGTNEIDTNSATAFRVENAGNNTFLVDTTNGRVGINKVPDQSWAQLDVSGSINSTGTVFGSGGLYMNTSSTNSGVLAHGSLAGTGGVNQFDVVILTAPSGGNSNVIQTTTAHDPRVYGIVTTTAAAGTYVSSIVGGHYTINVDTGAVAFGDQLVTSTTAGRATVDNNATTGIIGTALTTKAAGANGTVHVAVRPVGGQTSPTFGGTVTATALQADSLDRATAGALGIGNNTATSLSLCNSANCDTATIGTNADADAIQIGDSLDTLTLTGGSASTFVLNGATVDAAEFARLDGKDAALVDTNDAVNTAITGTGALTSGSIGSGFGTISTGNNITTTASMQSGDLRVGTSQATGALSIGNQTPNLNVALKIDRSQALAASTDIFGISGEIQATGTGTGTQTVYGLSFSGRANHTSGSINTYGLDVNTRNTNTGTVASSTGIRVAANTNTGGGAVTDNYGLVIADQTVGTNNYAVNIEGTSGLARQGIWWNKDTNLYRSQANQLKTDGNFYANTVQTTNGIQAQQGSATQTSIGAYGPGGEAGIAFGSASDASIYRVDASNLKTAETFDAAAYKVGGTAGSSVTCSGGQFLQNQVVSGGIVTGGTCAAGGSSSLQGAYDAGNTISTSTSTQRDIAFTLVDNTVGTDSDFTVTTADNSTGSVKISRASGAGTVDPAQLLLLNNADTDRAVPTAIKITAAAGGFTNVIDNQGTLISGAELNLLDGKDAALVDTNDAVTTAITGTGALNAGSITSGFGAIDTGADAITTTGTVTGGGLTATNSGATALNLSNTTVGTGLTIGGDTTLTRSAADTLATGSHLVLSGDANQGLSGAGLTDCDTAATSKLLWDTTTNKFSCGTDQTGGGSTLQGAYDADASGSADIVTTSTAKNILFKAGTGFDSGNVFEVQTSGGLPVLRVDTESTTDPVEVQIGSSTADATVVLFGLDSKDTTGDPTGANGAMYYNAKRQTLRCYENSRAWTDCLGTPKPNTRRWSYSQYPGSGTVFNNIGDVTTAGTAPTAIAATTTEPAMLNYATGATSGNVNHVSGNLNYDTDNLPTHQSYVVTQTTATVRYWVGLTNQTAATMAGSANPAGHYAAFRFDTGAADTNWKCITKDNVTQSITDSGVAAANTTGKKFEIVVTGTTVEFKINGDVVCTNTANRPAANTMLRYTNTVTTLAAAAANMRVGWLYNESEK